MKILLTGATGYIGKRLISVLISEGHDIYCVVRDRNRFKFSTFKKKGIYVVECDFLNYDSLSAIPDDIDIAYYLVHSMSASISDFEQMEKKSALNFKKRIEMTKVRQVIYLSGIINTKKLSRHLSSRKAVEEALHSEAYALTTLRAGIILGSGSASFEIIRDLVEKLPLMIAPRWLHTKSQPIGITNVVEFLSKIKLDEFTFNKSFDIGGPEVLSYKEMLERFAKIRKLKRWIFVLPIMTPKLSSYWLYFITSTNYKLAINLVHSMKVEIIGVKNDLHERLGIHLYSFDEAVNMAFDTIKQQDVLSSWTDALSRKNLTPGISSLIQVPTYGCFIDTRSNSIKNVNRSIDKIWSIGGTTGWYYANWIWKLRGGLDRLFGGVGLSRGRKNQHELEIGDALDFWRVVYANKKENRLLLYAEMRIPGEAWLEYKIKNRRLYQTATFRPRGIWGRFYWICALPFHSIIFSGMLKKISS